MSYQTVGIYKHVPIHIKNIAIKQLKVHLPQILAENVIYTSNDLFKVKIVVSLQIECVFYVI